MTGSRRTGWFLALGLGLAFSLGAALFALVFVLRSSRIQVSTPSPAPVGWVRLGYEVEAEGLSPAALQLDGATEPATMGGSECHALKAFKGNECYAYFKIAPALKLQITNGVSVEVVYFDADADGHLRLDYDSNEDLRNQAYTQSKEYVRLKGTQQWRKAVFVLENPRFEGRQNDGADFRLVALRPRFFLRSVRVLPE